MTLINRIAAAMREVHTESGSDPLPQHIYAQMAIAAVGAMRDTAHETSAVDAGLSILQEWEASDDYRQENLVASIYQAMIDTILAEEPRKPTS